MASKQAKMAALKAAAKKKFDESKIARVPAGQSGGGRFTSVSVTRSGGTLSVMDAKGQTTIAGVMAKQWNDHLSEVYGLKGNDVIQISDDDLNQIKAKKAPAKGSKKAAVSSTPKEAKVKPSTVSTPKATAPKEKKVKPSTVPVPKEPEEPVKTKQAVVQKATAKKEADTKTEASFSEKIKSNFAKLAEKRRLEKAERLKRSAESSVKALATKPPIFPSHKEAENWLKSHIPHTAFDLEGIDPQLLQGMAGNYVALAQEFPEVAATITHLGTATNSTKSLLRAGGMGYASAYADPNTGFLAINPNHFNDASKTYASNAANKRQSKSEFGEPFNTYRENDDDGLSNTVIHEFGHFIDFHLQKEAFGTIEMRSSINPPQISKAKNAAIKSIYSSLFGMITKDESKKISSYAGSNSMEMWAEGFATSKGLNPENQTPYVKAQTAAIDLMMQVSRGKKIPETEIKRRLIEAGIPAEQIEKNFS